MSNLFSNIHANFSASSSLGMFIPSILIWSGKSSMFWSLAILTASHSVLFFPAFQLPLEIILLHFQDPKGVGDKNYLRSKMSSHS